MIVDKAVEKCRLRLLAGTREQLNLISGTLAGGTPSTAPTTVTFKNAVQGIQPNAVIGVNYELMFVTASSDGGGTHTATVIRGYGGTTIAAAADGDIVQVNPKWSKPSILDEINNELDGISALGIFRVQHVDITYNAVIQGYDLVGLTAGSVDEILEVRRQTPGPYKNWPVISTHLVDFMPDAYATDFPSGMAIQIKGGEAFPGFDIHVVYKGQFTPSTVPLTDDLVTVCGLPATCEDIIEMGAAIRLAYAREVARNANFQQQTGTTKAQDEPAAAIVNAAKGWEALYQSRVDREVDRLERQFPRVRY